LKQFIGLRCDLAVHAGYIRYRSVPEGEHANSKRVSEDVVADYGANGQLLGIELLALDDAAMSQARSFAAANDLAFPRDLGGALIPT
jgi:uncharacterized protein YuzE